jgi:uncharacterized protein YukE
MTLPGNWDSSTISVDMSTMGTVAQAVLTSATNINNYLTDIINSLNGLPLSWTGNSATLAEDFNARWSSATTELYGTPSDPSTGILNIITAGLGQAAGNYSQNEAAVTAMFKGFGQAGSSSSGPQTQSVTDVVTDNVYHTTSVNETF